MKKSIITLISAITMFAGSLSVQATSLHPDTFSVYKTGVFEMYDSPRHIPNNFCDRGLKLVLDKAQIKGNVAFLTNYVIGMCEIYVYPNERSFDLQVTGTPCGSVVLEGKRVTLNGINKIKVIDHRLRRCKDIVPAQVIMTETLPNGQEITKYSK